MTRVSSFAELTSQLCLVQGRVMPTVSHSWKASLPIRCVGDLPRQADDRDRIHQRVGEAGDGIGRAGTGGHEDDAGLARRARIAFRRMDGTLLVADEDVADLVLLEQRVIDRKHRAARIAENGVHALIDQSLDDNFSACQFLGSHGSLPSVCASWPASCGPSTSLSPPPKT